MSNKIQIKRGLRTNLPTLDNGEPGFCTDTKEVFIGDGSNNYQILMYKDYSENSILIANTANTPEPLVVSQERIIGRKTGENISDLSPSDVLEMLSGDASQDFSINNQKITNLKSPDDPNDAANRDYVDNIIAANDAMVFKGTIGLGGDISIEDFNNLETYDTGWTYKVVEDGTIRGHVCEQGDMLVAKVTREGLDSEDSDWAVIQANIDGAVTGPSSSTNENIAVFDGTSGKTIKDGGKLISDLANSDHIHGNLNNDGSIGTQSGRVIVTGSDGELEALDEGSSGQFLRYDATWETPPDTATAANDILEGSNDGTQITYSPYSDDQSSQMRFYTNSTDPTGSSRLNIGAYFHATRLYEGSVRVLNHESDIDGGSFPTP